jgi:hypothetical protein
VLLFRLMEDRRDESRIAVLVEQVTLLVTSDLPREEKILLCNDLVEKIVSVYVQTAAFREELQFEYNEAPCSMGHRTYL